jgi:hypothetical protein
MISNYEPVFSLVLKMILVNFMRLRCFHVILYN